MAEYKLFWISASVICVVSGSDNKEKNDFQIALSYLLCYDKYKVFYIVSTGTGGASDENSGVWIIERRYKGKSAYD